MTSKLISNSEMLSINYMPERLLFRDSDRTKLQNAIANHIHTFIHGDTGSGKSILLRLAISDFTGKSIYIDCSLYQTTNAILREILSYLSSVIVSRSNYDLLKRLKEKSKNLKILACLDHVESLKDFEVISKLIGLDFLVILVSDKQEIQSKFTQLTKNTFTNVISLPVYTLEQSVAILAERAKFALVSWSYNDLLLKKIAKQCRGNIALGLNLLRSAAIKAESENKARIEEAHVPDVDCPDFLNPDQRILLKILEKHKILHSTKLYELYNQQSAYPKEERTLRKYMHNLVVRGFVRALGERNLRVYELVDRDQDEK